MREEKPQPTMKEIADRLRSAFIQVAGTVANDVDMESVTQEVIKDLNASKREVTLKLLGLDNRWGKWEVDHCNSHKSIIGEIISDECKVMVTQWVNDTIKEVLTEEMKAKTKAAIKKTFLAEISERHDYEYQRLVSSEVSNIVARMVADIKRECEVELGLKD